MKAVSTRAIRHQPKTSIRRAPSAPTFTWSAYQRFPQHPAWEKTSGFRIQQRTRRSTGYVYTNCVLLRQTHPPPSGPQPPHLHPVCTHAFRQQWRRSIRLQPQKLTAHEQIVIRYLFAAPPAPPPSSGLHTSSFAPVVRQPVCREIGFPLPSNQCQHRTLHIQKGVLPYTLC